MDYINILLQQEPEVLVPCAIGMIVVLNWALKLVMMVVKVGVTLSLIAALFFYLPHIT